MSYRNEAVSPRETILEGRAQELERQIEAWQDASRLVGGGGDPSSVTPAQLASYIDALSLCEWALESILHTVLVPRQPYGPDRYVLTQNEFAKIPKMIIDLAEEYLAGVPKDE